MELDFRIIRITIILFGMIFLTINSFDQAWAQDSTFAKDLIESTFLSEDSKIFSFLLFLVINTPKLV